MFSNKRRLDFKVTRGIFNGYRVFLTEDCVNEHRNKYSGQRRELEDDDFFDVEVVNAMNSPDLVYKSTRLDANKNIKFRKRQFVVYKERVDARCTFNGRELKFYVKICIKIRRLLKSIEIRTALYTDKVNDSKRCQPINNI